MDVTVPLVDGVPIPAVVILDAVHEGVVADRKGEEAADIGDECLFTASDSLADALEFYPEVQMTDLPKSDRADLPVLLPVGVCFYEGEFPVNSPKECQHIKPGGTIEVLGVEKLAGPVALSGVAMESISGGHSIVVDVPGFKDLLDVGGSVLDVALEGEIFEDFCILNQSSSSSGSGSSESGRSSPSSEGSKRLSSSKSSLSLRSSQSVSGWMIDVSRNLRRRDRFSLDADTEFLGVNSKILDSSEGVSKLSIVSVSAEGPWGGSGGFEFYDGIGNVVEVCIGYNDTHILSLQFSYCLDGLLFEGRKYGGDTVGRFSKVILNFPVEYIIHVEGTFAYVRGYKIITSLSFSSNKRVYGPYGMVEGEKFSSSGSGMVVGFFGRGGSYIDQLGVFSTALQTVPACVEGAWGGDGGFAFFDGRGEIVEITVIYNSDQIVSFQARYVQHGACFTGGIHGGHCGEFQKILLNFPEEYLVQIQGTFGSVPAAGNMVTSLSFITNMKTYGPYGAVRGQEFQSSQGSRIVGFYGRSCVFLDCIGVFTAKEWHHGLEDNTMQFQSGHCSSALTAIQTKKQVRKEVNAQGPWGGDGGSPFYDGRGDILEILVEYTDTYVISLQTTYEHGGGIFKTTARFGPGGNTAKIKLDYPQEQLLQIQGSIDDSFGTEMVTSLTFITTRKTYGPFGPVTDNKFESRIHGKIVGFYGRNDEFLDQIGVISEVLPENLEVTLTQGPWGGRNGTIFYDGKGDVVGIIVTYNNRHIISFQTIYSQGGAVFKADFHGGPGGKTAKILFKAPYEELIQVQGTTGKIGGDIVVTSLTFISNHRVYGPIGHVGDSEFQSSPHGRVTGFYGKAGICLDQMGFITHFSYDNCEGEVVAQGPWGGFGGEAFYDGRGELFEITICYNKAHIISLQMTYEHNGSLHQGERHGASGGDMTKISLKDPDSYLIQVKGTFGKVAGVMTITSLVFITNKHTFGPFGCARGQQFQTYKHGKVVGFFGASSATVEQLGVISKLRAERYQDEMQMRSMGPWGGQGGVNFHDGYGEIREIHVWYSKSQVMALQVVYEQGGTVLRANNHGGTSGGSHVKIPFKRSVEELIQIKGSCGHVSGEKMITSLTFISNKRAYGPFGRVTGEVFQTPIVKRIVGFFGRAAAALHQIGTIVIEESQPEPIY